MRLIVVLAVVAALVVGCADDPQQPGPADFNRFDLAPAATITADEDGLSPASVTVTSGEVILLKNDGTGPHSFVGGEDFDSGTIAPGEAQTLVLDVPGTYSYHDGLAPDHTGKITVRPAPPGAG
jgi:plastocyanin